MAGCGCIRPFYYPLLLFRRPAEPAFDSAGKRVDARRSDRTAGGPEQPASRAGRQTITLTGCLIDELVLAKYTAGDEILDEDLSGTFDAWDMPESFNLLDGME